MNDPIPKSTDHDDDEANGVALNDPIFELYPADNPYTEPPAPEYCGACATRVGPPEPAGNNDVDGEVGDVVDVVVEVVEVAGVVSFSVDGAAIGDDEPGSMSRSADNKPDVESFTDSTTVGVEHDRTSGVLNTHSGNFTNCNRPAQSAPYK